MDFGVDRHLQRLFRIGMAIDVDMADAIKVFDNRHPGIAADALDQTLAAPWHNHINVVRHGDQLSDRSAVRCLDHLHRILGQSRFREPHGKTAGNGLVGMNGL